MKFTGNTFRALKTYIPHEIIRPSSGKLLVSLKEFTKFDNGSVYTRPGPSSYNYVFAKMSH